MSFHVGNFKSTNQFSGGHSVWVPPDPISNSEVKPFCADDSVGSPHVKVGHRRVYKTDKPPFMGGFFVFIIRDYLSLALQWSPCDKNAGSVFEQRASADPGGARAGTARVK